MIEHLNSECDYRVDGHHIGTRCLSIGLWGQSLLYLGDRTRVSYLLLSVRHVDVEMMGLMK